MAERASLWVFQSRSEAEKPTHEMPLPTHGMSLGRAVAEDTVDAGKEYSDRYYRRLLWKIDLWLLPLMWVCYGTQQADKTSLSTQAVFGIREDTELIGEQFNWLSTIFYLTYLVCEAPGNWLLQRFHTGRFLGVVMVLWGIVVLCIAFARNFVHLMVLRALQGALECTISPTFVLITGAWYRSHEHTFRSTIWGTANAGMSIITGLIMYGIGAHAEANPGSLAAVRVNLGGHAFRLGCVELTCQSTVERSIPLPRLPDHCLWHTGLVHTRDPA